MHFQSTFRQDPLAFRRSQSAFCCSTTVNVRSIRSHPAHKAERALSCCKGFGHANNNSHFAFIVKLLSDPCGGAFAVFNGHGGPTKLGASSIKPSLTLTTGIPAARASSTPGVRLLSEMGDRRSAVYFLFTMSLTIRKAGLVRRLHPELTAHQ